MPVISITARLRQLSLIILFMLNLPMATVQANPEIVTDYRSQDLSYIPYGPAPAFSVNGVMLYVLEGQLWSTDGTNNLRLTDLPADLGNFISNFVKVGNIAYFTAVGSDDRQRLWKSDGTAAGTVRVSSNEDGWSPKDLTVIEDTLYFRAYGARSGYELWKSDGTDEGTVLVKDINPGLGSSMGNDSFYVLDIIVAGDMLYFVADNGISGFELWKSDGTEAGTMLVKDIRPGGDGSSLASLVALGGTVFFVANDGMNGRELWKSDGTEAGTQLVKDIYTGSEHAFGKYKRPIFIALGNSLYFNADDGVNGTELWRTDGYTASTVLVKDINPGSGPGFSKDYPSNMIAFDGMLYFTASDGVGRNSELWKSDGTDAGTIVLAYGISPRDITVVGQELYFMAFDVHGYELWKSDGTVAGTGLIKDISPGKDSSFVSARYGNQLDIAVVDSTLFFVADDGVSGYELWKSDGTEVGTSLVMDINPGNNGSFENIDAFYAPILDSTLYFNADDGVHGRQLWKYAVPIAIGTGVIGDYVWVDLNANGVQDSYETGLPGVSIDLLSCSSGAVVDSRVTDVTGSFRFTGVPVGEYQMHFHLPLAYRYSPTGSGGDYRFDSNVNTTTGMSPCLPMTDGQQRLALDAGMVPDSANSTGSFGDYVWDDLNRDGVQDSNEAGLANVMIDLMTCSGAVQESVTTDASGRFLFSQLAAGDYQMYFHLPAGYTYSPAGQSGDYRTDSNVNNTTGMSPCLTIDGHQRIAVDAGMMQ